MEAVHANFVSLIDFAFSSAGRDQFRLNVCICNTAEQRGPVLHTVAASWSCFVYSLDSGVEQEEQQE